MNSLLRSENQIATSPLTDKERQTYMKFVKIQFT